MNYHKKKKIKYTQKLIAYPEVPSNKNAVKQHQIMTCKTTLQQKSSNGSGNNGTSNADSVGTRDLNRAGSRSSSNWARTRSSSSWGRSLTRWAGHARGSNVGGGPRRSPAWCVGTSWDGLITRSGGLTRDNVGGGDALPGAGWGLGLSHWADGGGDWDNDLSGDGVQVLGRAVGHSDGTAGDGAGSGAVDGAGSVQLGGGARGAHTLLGAGGRGTRDGGAGGWGGGWAARWGSGAGGHTLLSAGGAGSRSSGAGGVSSGAGSLITLSGCVVSGGAVNRAGSLITVLWEAKAVGRDDGSKAEKSNSILHCDSKRLVRY